MSPPAQENRRTSVRIATTLVIFFLTLRGAGAQINTAEQPRWDISLFAAGATGEQSTNSFTEAQIVTAGVYVGRMLNHPEERSWYRGRWEYGADIAPLFLQFAPNRVHGLAFDPFIFRWNPSAYFGRLTPFLELGGGGLRTTANFPVGDTSNFNFIARGGGGVQIATHHYQAIEFACRWWHISNANLGNRNPEFNGIQVSVGYHWFKEP